LIVKFECINKSTIVVLAREENPGIYVFHADKKWTQHYYCDTRRFKDYYATTCWKELPISKRCL